MIVIMRDAVMPECCNTCVCSEGYGCGITGTLMETKEMESRPDWCPLEKVEPCEDAVSKEAVLDVLRCCYDTEAITYDNGNEYISYDQALDLVDKLSPVTPKRKKGKWIEEQRGIKVTLYKCSECGRAVIDDTSYDAAKDFPFCHCGADMRQREENK